MNRRRGSIEGTLHWAPGNGRPIAFATASAVWLVLENGEQQIRTSSGRTLFSSSTCKYHELHSIMSQEIMKLMDEMRWAPILFPLCLWLCV